MDDVETLRRDDLMKSERGSNRGQVLAAESSLVVAGSRSGPTDVASLLQLLWNKDGNPDVNLSELKL